MANISCKDAVVVPTGVEGSFDIMFRKGYWHTLLLGQNVIKKLVRIDSGIFLPGELEFIYAYESTPHSAITMRAEIKLLCQNRGNENQRRFHVYFKGPPKKIKRVPKGKGAIRGPFVTSSAVIANADTIDDVFKANN